MALISSPPPPAGERGGRRPSPPAPLPGGERGEGNESLQRGMMPTRGDSLSSAGPPGATELALSGRRAENPETRWQAGRLPGAGTHKTRPGRDLRRQGQPAKGPSFLAGWQVGAGGHATAGRPTPPGRG